MGMPPIFRIAAWFERRAGLCRMCKKAPARAELSGYCSDECAELDAEMQAHA
jgi:hypothetical protein